MSLPFQLDQKILNKRVLSISLYQEKEIYGLLVKSNKGELQHDLQLNGWEDITTFLNTHSQVPVVVTLYSSKILTVVHDQKIESEHLDAVFSEHVPMGTSEEFYMDHALNVAGFARKAFVDDLIKPLERYEERILGVYLMPIAAIEMGMLLSSQEGSMELAGYQYHFQEDHILQLTECALEGKQVEHQWISEEAIIAYSGAIHFISNNSNSMDGFTGKKQEWVYQRLVTTLKFPLLGVLLVLLLINAILFFQFDGVNQELSDRSRTIQQLQANLQSIQQYLDANEEIFQAQDHQYSILSDQIGFHTISGVVLSRIVVRPPGGRRGQEAFSDNKLILEGQVQNATVFSQWIDRLQSQSWMIGIEDQYLENVDGEGELSQFRMALTYDADELE